jgi:hypothetical protein
LKSHAISEKLLAATDFSHGIMSVKMILASSGIDIKLHLKAKFKNKVNNASITKLRMTTTRYG